jgi:hypothetical protein
MPFIAQKFPSYSEFASASLEEVYGSSLQESYEREIDSFNSYLLLSDGNGNFTPVPLPPEAQMTPVFDLVATDLNGDGLEDLILAGNIYETEVETPRLDALSGTSLLSKGDGSYEVLPHSRTGLYMRGNVKSLQPFKEGDALWVLVGRNNDAPLLYLLSGNNNAPLTVASK